MFSQNKEPLRATPLNDPPPAPAPPPPKTRGLKFYVEGGWLFFKRMWPALYDLSTNQTYVYASAIAFNALMSFFSFIVLIGSLLNRVMHWKLGYETIYRLMFVLVPIESKQIFDSLDEVTRGKGGEVGVISFGLLIIGAAGVFQSLEIALNHAWGFKEERNFIKAYTLYPALVIAIGLILFVCVGIASGWDWLLQAVFGDGLIRKIAFKSLGAILLLPCISIIFFLIYYWVPTGKVKANQIAFAAIGIACLWEIGSLIFKGALAIPAVSDLIGLKTSYGQLFSIMAIVTWIFFSSFLLILGANLSAKEILPRAWNRE